MAQRLEQIVWVDNEDEASPDLQEEYIALGLYNRDSFLRRYELVRFGSLLRATLRTSHLALRPVLAGNLRHLIEGTDSGEFAVTGLPKLRPTKRRSRFVGSAQAVQEGMAPVKRPKAIAQPTKDGGRTRRVL
ncbi:hypothetical protein M231_07409 [Tremella mesenterica]|uniref:Uncharacterized protein n=1 Tax=Tremella mesenterica TaxID=5217 RepID=A0A4Q1BBA0_TREME|nr:hypothetical protein M231_07409 [Tremella mesenterica]